MSLESVLSSMDSQAIMECFNNMKPLLVELGDGFFICVHMIPDKRYTVIEQSNYWLLGKFNE